MSLITTIKSKLKDLEVEALTDIHTLCNRLACRGEKAPATKEGIIADIEGKAASLGDKALSDLHEAVTAAAPTGSPAQEAAPGTPAGISE